MNAAWTKPNFQRPMEGGRAMVYVVTCLLSRGNLSQGQDTADPYAEGAFSSNSNRKRRASVGSAAVRRRTSSMAVVSLTSS